MTAKVFLWLRAKWRARLREIDRQVLWPSCCEHAGSIDTAIEVFMVHASMDPSWSEEMTPEQAADLIRGWGFSGG